MRIPRYVFTIIDNKSGTICDYQSQVITEQGNYFALSSHLTQGGIQTRDTMNDDDDDVVIWPA